MSFGVARALLAAGAESGCGFNVRLCPPPTGGCHFSSTAPAVTEGTQMGAGRQAAEAYRKILASAKKHDVAVMGGPVLTPNAEGCRKALEDGVHVFCLGLESMAFRSWCEATVRALANGIEGQSEWRRPAVPESGFPRKLLIPPATRCSTQVKKES